MDADRDLTTADRIAHLLRHLGIARAHFAGGAAEAAARPELVASLALVAPTPGVAGPLRALADGGGLARPPLVVHGDRGVRGELAPRVLAAYPGATAVALPGYASMLWSDVVADRAAEVGAALLAHLGAAERAAPLPAPQLAGEGEVAGVTYRARGSGPPVLLFPLDLAPAQWEPLISALAARYCTLTLGGPWLGVVAILEQRAAGGYGRLFGGLLDALGLPPGGAVLEVGCGSGMLTRPLARRAGAGTTVVGLDINPYLLREAASLARLEGLGDRITFQEGRAEALPFPDHRFDTALACTTLEELDADRALAELARVVRPGGRVGVLVRAEDLPPWDSLPLPPATRAKLAGRRQTGAAAGGCADASLYHRLGAAGLALEWAGPQLATDRPGPGQREWRAYCEGTVLTALDAAEADAWRAAAARAEAEGTYLWAWAYHCAVGAKP